MKRLLILLLSLFANFSVIHLRASDASTLAWGVGGLAALGGATPGQAIEQIYYLGTYDPDMRVPPTFFRVRVRGQASWLSKTTFGSGWVPAVIADTLGDNIGNGIANNGSPGNSFLSRSGASFLQYGPEGFRVVPDNNRLVIVMGSDPSSFFKMVDRTVAGLKSAAASSASADQRTLKTQLATIDTSLATLDDLGKLVSIQPAGATRVIVLTGSLDFGEIVIDKSAGAPATPTKPITVAVDNKGTAPLNIFAIVPPNDAFKPDWLTFPVQIPVGGSKPLVLTFSPTAVNDYAGTLTIKSDATSGPGTGALKGAGVAATRVLVADPANLAFGDAPLAVTKSLTLKLKNDGNSDLTVKGFTPPPGFTVTPKAGKVPAKIAARGGVFEVTVDFLPTSSLTAYDGKLAVDSDKIAATEKASGPDSIDLTGKGVAATRELKLTPSVLAFGDVTVDQIKTFSTTVKNTGNAPVEVTGLTLSGAALPSALTTSWHGGTIAANNGTIDLAVTFVAKNTTISGPLGLTLAAATPLTGTAPTVTVTGSPVPATKVLSTDANVDFGDVVLGQTKDKKLKLKNTGNTVLIVKRPDAPGGDFTVDWDGGPVTPDDPQEITLHYAPKLAAAADTPATATLTFVSDGVPASLPVSLRGNPILATRIIEIPQRPDFGDTAINEETTADLTIFNRGNDTLKLTARPLVTAPFFLVWLPEKGLEISPRGSLTLKFKFKPTVAGPVTTTIRIPTDKTVGSEFVTLTAKTK